MMSALGDRLCASHSKAKVVIGFAETATAIGAVVASQLKDCIYIHTTREQLLERENCLCFQEEHSHAVDQSLYYKTLREAFATTEEVILVDDEISTGKTLINIVAKIKETFPCLKNVPFIAASLINRVSKENVERLLQNGIVCEALLKLPNESYDSLISKYDITAPKEIKATTAEYSITEKKFPPIADPRLGVNAALYAKKWQETALQAAEQLRADLSGCQSVAVVGTEECMYPSLAIGQALEKAFTACKVCVHATTRSPIGVCQDVGYPIQNGYKLHSFYEAERETFIYNVARYDAVIIVSDSAHNTDSALLDLCSIFTAHGCKQFFMLRGNNDV